MSHTKMKSSGRSTSSNHQAFGQSLDKKIKEYAVEIKQSNMKIDQFITKIEERVALIVSGRLDKFILMHSQIINQKNKQIKTLQQNCFKHKSTSLHQTLQTLQKTVLSFKQEIQRITTIKQMFRKEASKYKIELQIMRSELATCRNRQKKLIKRTWILQEDIKDIYSSEVNIHENNYLQEYKKYSKKNTLAKHFDKDKEKKVYIRYCTEPSQSMQSFRNQYEEKYTGKKSNHLSKAKTPMSKYMNDSIEQQARITTNTFNYYHIHNQVNLSQPRSTSQLRPTTENRQSSQPTKSRYLETKKSELNIYDQLRMNLRRANRNRQLQPKYVDETQRMIKKQDYTLICLNGPKIMHQIQQVMIDNYGPLKDVDQFSIQLLNMLFKNDNALKILEIVLFNYSVNALDEIKSNQKQLRNEKQYGQLTILQDQPQKIQLGMMVQRNSIQPSIKRKVKNKIEYFKNNYFSQRTPQ